MLYINKIELNFYLNLLRDQCPLWFCKKKEVIHICSMYNNIHVIHGSHVDYTIIELMMDYKFTY